MKRSLYALAPSALAMILLCGWLIPQIALAQVPAPAAPWIVSGNRNTDPAVNFLGTTDATNFIIRTNNLQRILVGADGNIQFGTQGQQTNLNVNGNIDLTGIITARGGAHFGSTTDYGTFSSSGDFRLYGSADYLVSENRYIFRTAENEAIGLYYDDLNSQFKITSDIVPSLFSINYKTGNSSFTGHVGIGIAASSSKALNVKGDADLDGDTYISGNVGIGIAASSSKALNVKGDADLDGAVGVGGTNSDPTSYALYVNGRLRSNGINELSDRRMKRDVVSLEGALASILQLRGVRYEWQREAYPALNLPAGKQLGLIAQEVEPVVPEVVLTDAEGIKSVEYSHLVPLLIEAVKEQQAVIEQQALALEQMRAEMEGLRLVLGRVAPDNGGQVRLTRTGQQ